MIERRQRRVVTMRGASFGGDAPILVQSMTNTDTRDIPATLHQIHRLQHAGCELVRLAVLNSEAGAALRTLRDATEMPLAADIHFDYRLALQAIDAGFDKLRLNPGNIGGAERVRQVARKAKAAGIPIRIGINAASLEKEIMAKHGAATPEAMVESALSHVQMLEQEGFDQILVSLKAPDVLRTVQAYRLMADCADYPLHIGITHAGPPNTAIVVSSVGLGILLAEGLGDTIRVSLTGDPVLEVDVAWRILSSLELRLRGARLVSCPTCGRCQVDLTSLAEQVERLLASYQGPPITVAVMGCEVNGPGEAREADLGLAAGQGLGLIFRKGNVVAKVPPERFLEAFLDEFQTLTGIRLTSS